MVENVYIYHEEETNENVNMRQEVKLIISKAILKRSNLETINKTEEDEEADMNLRKGSNQYQYNVIDDFC